MECPGFGCFTLATLSACLVAVSGFTENTPPAMNAEKGKRKLDEMEEVVAQDKADAEAAMQVRA